MAKFKMNMPTEILSDIDFISHNTLNIFGDTVKAGALVAKKQIQANANKAFSGEIASKMNKKLKVTKVYQTKDGSIKDKVAYYGYLATKKTKAGGSVKVRSYRYPQGVPAPLLAALREFGAKSGSGMPKQFKNYWTKKPFVRPAFSNSAPIESAMLAAQKRASRGLLK